MLKINKTIKLIVLMGGLIFLAISLTMNNRIVQREWGTVLSGLNLERYSQLCKLYDNKSDSELINLLKHGDAAIENAAGTILMRRNNPELFDAFLDLLHDPNEEVRMSARALLKVAPDRAVHIYLKELDRADILDVEVQQIFGIMADLKRSEAFPALQDYVRNDINNKRGSSELMKACLDPRGIAALEELLKNSPYISNYEKKRVEKAIEYLRALEAPSIKEAGK